MNSDLKSEYKDLIKSLSSLDEIRASKKLANKISLLAKQKSKTKSHWPQLLLTRAAFFAVILALLTGGGIYASEKVDSEKVVEPIKNAAIQFQATLKKKSTTKTSEEEANNKRGEDESQNSKNSTEDGSNNKESDKDSKDSNENNASGPTPEPTTKPESVLGDVSEELPEPAKGVVEGVKEALENKPPQSNNNQDGQENSESENNTPGVDIDIENKKNKGNENSSKDIELDINPPFLQGGGE